MIVRINQFDAANAEPYSGWENESLRGPITSNLPAGANAFEILILESDERQQTLAPSFRQGQLRKLLPDILAALRDPADEVVLRLDGPMLAGELLAAFAHLTDAGGHGRFAISPAHRYEDLTTTPPAIGSVRIHAPVPRLPAILDDDALGLQRNVRLRAFALPEALVNPLLDVDELNDERWPEILAGARYVLGNVRSMQSLHILTHKLSADQTRQRIVQRLSAAANQM